MRPGNKYGNRKVHVDGMTFDSKKEYSEWCKLETLQRAGEIRDLKRQVKFELLPVQRDENGKVIERSWNYIADFTYEVVKTGEYVVADAKGFKTEEYIGKRKMMLWKYGIRIKEI